jgi:hypothetical protein
MDDESSSLPVAERETERLSLRSGAEAIVARSESGDVLTVRDARGHVLFELHEATGKVLISVAEGDLELRAERGRVRLSGAEGVDIEGKHVNVTAEHLRQAVGVLETQASRILEKARDVYRDVEGLSQLRAGHVRIVAKQTLRALADRVRLKAKKDAKIDGEKIFLG